MKRAVFSALIILAAFLVFMSVPGSRGVAYGAAQTWTRHVDKENGYSLTIPKDWIMRDTKGKTVMNDPKGKVVLGLICPADQNAKGIPTSIAVLTKETTMTLDQCGDFYENDYRKSNQTFKLLERSKVAIGNAQAVKLHFTMQLITYVPPKYETYHFKQAMLSYILTNGARAYNLVFMSEVGKFATYKTMFEGIALTFRFD